MCCIWVALLVGLSCFIDCNSIDLVFLMLSCAFLPSLFFLQWFISCYRLFARPPKIDKVPPKICDVHIWLAYGRSNELESHLRSFWPASGEQWNGSGSIEIENVRLIFIQREKRSQRNSDEPVEIHSMMF
jgi:hypothetical protein